MISASLIRFGHEFPRRQPRMPFRVGTTAVVAAAAAAVAAAGRPTRIVSFLVLSVFIPTWHSSLLKLERKRKKKRVQGPQKADSSQRQREARPFMSHTPKRFRRSSSPQALSRPVVISTVVGDRSKPFASPRFCGS